MKKLKSSLALASVLFAACDFAEAQLFFQDFQSSTTLSTYINLASPNSGQFNAISTSGAGVTISTAGNNLAFTRAGANAGAFSRTTDFSPTPLALRYVFDLSVSGNSVLQTTAATWQIGSGFGTGNATEANANTYARFGLNLTTTPGQFQLRDITNGTNSANFSGNQTITWVLNNTGSTINYTAPNATNQTLSNDTASLWVGSTLVFNNVAVQTAAQTMTDLKFVFSAGSATITMDNFAISAIPEPHEYGIAVVALLGVAVLIRRRQKAQLAS